MIHDMIHISREIEIDNDSFEVWISAGVQPYDTDHDGTEWDIWGITWNKAIYSDYANELIAKDLKDNSKDVDDQLIQKFLRICSCEL